MLIGTDLAMTSEDSGADHLSADAIAVIKDHGEELSSGGRHQAPASAWQRVLALRPDHAPALNHLGTQAMNRGELELARDYFTRAIARDPKFAMPQANLSRLHSLRGDRAAAIKAIDGAITAEPTGRDRKSNRLNPSHYCDHLM